MVNSTDNNSFPVTRWTLILQAKDRSEETLAFNALSTLCESYRKPLLTFLIRSGASIEDAEDTIQGFFAVVNEKRYMDAADQSKGRMRTFLLDALKKYRAKEYRASQAQKRGGGVALVSIDETNENGQHVHVPTDDGLTPETAFDRQWALTFLEKVIQRMRGDYIKKDKQEEFNILKPFLATGGGAPYGEIATQLDITENNVKIKVKRLRERYRKLLEDEVAQTLNSKGGVSVKEELGSLLEALG
ncbi:MAG: sigma-70 family RNA polymerase sigma factor [Verrucomicrobia bacterium]|nr:sigma-70 family RNA polymerase sigma factor [Verrucomicrobiota bacterium]